MGMIWCLMRQDYLLAAMILASFSGCSGPQVQPIDHLTGSGLDQSLPNASLARWEADFDRLIYDIPRAVKKLHWGLIGVQNVPSATGEVTVLRAEALLPNGHVATIVAWRSHSGFMAVALRVGHFGDRRQERVFISQLAKILRGKPSRRHRQTFELPMTER